MSQAIAVFADTSVQIEAREEFLGLCEACDVEIEKMFFQNLKEINHRTYIGKGKVEEIALYIQEHEIDCILFSTNLSAIQLKHLEEAFQIPVLDYSDVILEIFAKRAKSPLSRLQVECARLKRILPRLIGANQSLSRQGGSGFNKGSGETQLELDKRRIKSRISEIERELKRIEKQRATQRQSRLQGSLPIAALIGYTNAGKSTLMNSLLAYTKASEEKKVLQQDMLFATLDTSLRKIELPQGSSFLLSDTVGFISNLPHELIDAFHSTLEEVTYADVLLEVIDISDEQHLHQMEITKETLHTIHAGHIPLIRIFNQCDKTEIAYPKAEGDEIYISAIDPACITFLLEQIQTKLFPDRLEVQAMIPYEHGNLISYLHEHAQILKLEYEAEGIFTQIKIEEKYLYPIKPFVLKT